MTVRQDDGMTEGGHTGDKNPVIIVVCGMPLSYLIWIRVHFQ